MKVRNLHPWDLTPKQAIALQNELRGQVTRADRIGDVSFVAGIDVGFEEGGAVTRAAVAVLSFPALEPVDAAIARLPTSFPYMPGLLSFREAPAVIAALQCIKTAPDLLLYDGQGIAHPRRLGIASHVGLLTDTPTIGVAKTRLIGSHAQVPDVRGSWVALRDQGEVIGAVLRTRVGVKPLYVSIGHRISLETAIRWVIACTGRFRLPETTRHAHRLASGPASGPPDGPLKLSRQRP